MRIIKHIPSGDGISQKGMGFPVYLHDIDLMYVTMHALLPIQIWLQLVLQLRPGGR